MSISYTLNTAPVGQVLYGVYGTTRAFLTLVCCRVKESPSGGRSIWGHSTWEEDEDQPEDFRTMGWNVDMCEYNNLVLFRTKLGATVYMSNNISEPFEEESDD